MCLEQEILTWRPKAGICFFCIIYTYFRVPEPSGRTFAELDLLFEQGVSARQFSKTQVNVFDKRIEGQALENYEKQLDRPHGEKS